MPITGAYIITSHYGQYSVEGLRNVKLDNKGIDIQGKPGAQARAIFNGKVAAVFKLNGLFNILVRRQWSYGATLPIEEREGKTESGAVAEQIMII